MNLLAFRTALRKRIGNPTTAEVPDTELDDRINEAVIEITDRYGFNKGRKVVTFPTVISQSRYTLPTDCSVLMKLTNPAENKQLHKRDETWAAERATLEDGKPTDYLRQRDWIELFPPPDDVYTLQMMYKVIAPTLSVDADEPVFPSTWDSGVIYLARFKYWETQGDLAKAGVALNIWKDWVANKPSEIAEEDFADNTEGVVLPFLRRSSLSNSFDREDE